MNLQTPQLCFAPENDSIPSFTNPTPGGAQENLEDENDILTDQDQTTQDDDLTRDENMGASSQSLEPLEDEPADFMRGELDVREQMDRAADALDSSIHGFERQSDEDSPRGDLGASFQDTPGGLEEVEQKTDEDLARRKGFRQTEQPVPASKPSPERHSH